MPLEVKSLAEWEREGIADMLSVVIPAHNEEGHIADSVKGVAAALDARLPVCDRTDTWINRNQGVQVQNQGNGIAEFFSSCSIASWKRPWGTQICGHRRSCARRSSTCGTVETGARASPVSNDSS